MCIFINYPHPFITHLSDETPPPAIEHNKKLRSTTDLIRPHMEKLCKKNCPLVNFEFATGQLQKCLPHIARVFLLATFIEDGIRVAYQAEDQHRFISVAWMAVESWWPAWLLIGFSVLGQVVPCCLVLCRKAVLPASVWLVFMVLYHTVLYKTTIGYHFFTVHMAILGGLLLLTAETQLKPADVKVVSVGVPNPNPPNDKRSKSFLLLVGRICVPLMFISMLHFELNDPARVLELCVACVLMGCVVIGFKARWSALALGLWLLGANLVLNNFWKYPATHPYREFVKFDFFQTLSVVGGMLLLFCHGPGKVSLDEYNKKNW